MKCVCAIDSLKGSLSSTEAGKAAKEGILRVYPEAQVIVKPIADGGEGTVEALVTGMGGTFCTVTVTGPLGDPVKAVYGVLPGGETAVMEMSAAAGITLVPKDSLCPAEATTYGVGEMIAHAIENGCRRILLGIGGSATNDGGVGMLQALGFGMLDQNGKQVPFGVDGVSQLCRITTDHVVSGLASCDIVVACDVDNPLCGERGCTAVFGPQKGVTADDVPLYDECLSRYAALCKTVVPTADDTAAGAGAAGGMGFATATFLNATLKSGIAMILDEIGLENDIAAADVVITGEGRLDAQSAMGKAPCGVAALAKRHQKPVIAFAGGIGAGAFACHAAGIDAMFPIVRGVCTLDEALDGKAAFENMASAVEQAFRLHRAMC